MKKFFVFILFLIFFFYPFIKDGFPQTVKEFFEQGISSYNQGDYDTASEIFRQITEIYPQFAIAYNYLGISLREKGGNFQDAIWSFKKALNLDPKYVEAYNNLGKIYYGLKDFEKAEEYCLKAVNISPDFLSAQLSLAWVYLLGKSEPKKAIPYFHRVIEKKGDIALAHYGLGIAYLMTEDRFKALEMITTLKQINQDDLAGQLESLARGGRVSMSSLENLSLVKATRESERIPSSESFEEYSSNIQVPLRSKMPLSVSSLDSQ